MSYRDDVCDANRYLTQYIPPPAEAVLALVATTGVDMGLATSERILATLAIVPLIVYLVTGSPWYTMGTYALLQGLAMVYVRFRRWGQDAVARALVGRYGAARFKVAKPDVDKANEILKGLR